MKIKLISLLVMLLSSYSAKAQLTYAVKNKSYFTSENKKPSTVKIGSASFITHVNPRGETVVMYKKNNKTTVLHKLKLIPMYEVEVTGFDMDGDKVPEILIIYTSESGWASAIVYSGTDFKKIGVADHGGNYALLKDRKICFQVPHEQITENKIYYVKNGKLIFDEENSIF